MNISIISFTGRGHALSARIAACMPEDCVTQYAKAEGFAAYESVHAFAARAMAEDSADFEEILLHYYSGTEIKKLLCQTAEHFDTLGKKHIFMAVSFGKRFL